MICPHCHQAHPDNAKFCPITGLEIQISKKECPNCHKEIDTGLLLCPFCGANAGVISQKDIATQEMVIAERPKRGSLKWIFGSFIVIGSFLTVLGIYLTFFSAERGHQAVNAGSTTPSAQISLFQSGKTNELTLTPAAALDSLESQVAQEPNPKTAIATQAVPTSAPSHTPQPTSTPQPTATPLPTSTPTQGNQSVGLETNPVDGAEIVFVPAGEFLMGSDADTDPYFYGAEGPSHPVYLDEYWIYRTEVTNAMYQKCVDVQACPRPTRNISNTREDYFTNPDYANFPVVYVTWRFAAAYCVWVGGRLPSEAEWEKAARGSDGRLFPWGDQAPNDQLVRFNTNDTIAVGNYPAGASPYGAYDMAGNVIEWVFDFFDPNYYTVSPEENPLGPANGSKRVYRGGSYHNPADGIRTVMRGSRQESHSNVDIGFRCVVDKP